MALLNTQTIFNLLITLIVGAALYYYIRYKFRVLELTQREHAKVLQSVIISMNNTQNQCGRGQYVNYEMAGGGVGGHALSDINQDIERFKQVNNGSLIDVSDNDEDDTENESDSGSDDSDSDSGSSGSSGSDSDGEDNEEESYNTKKIIIGGNIESQTIEHLTGPDVKVIELSHPLYPSQNGNHDDAEHDNDDDDEDDDDEDDEDDDSSENGNGNNTANIEEVTSTLDGVEYLENLDNVQHKLKTDATDAADAADETDEISIKTVFKNKESDTHAHNDFNGMNVQSLRQLYKQRLLTEGKNMSEAAIGKLTKKELIKNLQQ